MQQRKTQTSADSQNQLIADIRRSRDERDKAYRAQALKMNPSICARCGREFSGKKLRELTVHHKDHDHDNNPPDGSNWELLCLYCHDNEHQKYLEHEYAGKAEPINGQNPTATFKPFSELETLLKKQQE